MSWKEHPVLFPEIYQSTPSFSQRLSSKQMAKVIHLGHGTDKIAWFQPWETWQWWGILHRDFHRVKQVVDAKHVNDSFFLSCSWIWGWIKLTGLYQKKTPYSVGTYKALSIITYIYIYNQGSRKNLYIIYKFIFIQFRIVQIYFLDQDQTFCDPPMPKQKEPDMPCWCRNLRAHPSFPLRQRRWVQSIFPCERLIGLI